METVGAHGRSGLLSGGLLAARGQLPPPTRLQAPCFWKVA